MFKENIHVISELKQNQFDIALVEGLIGTIALIPKALEIPYIVQAECLIEPNISGYLNLPSQSSYIVPMPLNFWQAKILPHDFILFKLIYFVILNLNPYYDY